MDVQLVVIKGTAQEQALRLREADTIVGRRSGCGLRIPSRAVSRRHCILRFDDGLLTVEDLKSANGTFVNGVRVRDSMIIRPGDMLRIGPVTFQVRYHLTEEAMDRLLREQEEELLEAIPVGEGADESTGEDDEIVEVEILEGGDGLDPIPMDDAEQLPGEAPAEPRGESNTTATEKHQPGPTRKGSTKKSAKKKTISVSEEESPPAAKKKPPQAGKPRPPDAEKKKPSAKDKKQAAAAAGESEEDTPDASLLFGKGRKWEMPQDQDLRDILSQLEDS